jgi:hypothetical protein
MGLRFGPDVVDKREISCPYRKQNSFSSVVHPVASIQHVGSVLEFQFCILDPEASCPDTNYIVSVSPGRQMLTTICFHLFFNLLFTFFHPFNTVKQTSKELRFIHLRYITKHVNRKIHKISHQSYVVVYSKS